jgi:hypothetical protein
MTQGHKILSVQLSTEELAMIDAAAQTPEFGGNRSKYARRLIIDGDQSRLEADRQLQQQKQLLDQQEQDCRAQRDQLHVDYQAQIDRLQARLTSAEQAVDTYEVQLEQQQQALSRVEAENVDLFIKCETGKLEHEFQVSRLEEALTTARQSEQQWKSECQQAKAQLKESQKGQKRVEDAATMVKALEQFLTANPGIGQGIKQGLGHLFAPKPSEPPEAEHKAATKLGEAIARDFPGAQLNTIVTLLRYLRDTPQEKNALLAQPGFVAYQAKSWTAHQQQTTKKQGKNQ